MRLILVIGAVVLVASLGLFGAVREVVDLGLGLSHLVEHLFSRRAG